MSTLEQVAEFFRLPFPLQSPSPISLESFTRDDLPVLFHRLGYRVGAEVGVEVGRYSKVLCENNPGVRLHCVDAWKAYRGYREHVTQAKVDGFFEVTKERLAAYDVSFCREFSVDAARTFAPNSLDFVYIDANHRLEYVIADIAAWLPLVKSGGIISGHDYAHRGGNGYQCHVIEAVNAWTTCYKVDPWFLVGSLANLPGKNHPTAQSWFWVKP